MNKKRMTEKRFCRRIAVVMMAVLVAMTALPAFSEVTASAAEKAKNMVQLRIGGKKMTKKTFRNFLREEDGMGTVEVILIIVVLIGLVIIFKTQLTQIVNNIFEKISSQSSSI